MIRSHTLSVHLRTPAVPHVNEKGPLGESSFKVKKITKLGSKSKGKEPLLLIERSNCTVMAFITPYQIDS